MYSVSDPLILQTVSAVVQAGSAFLLAEKVGPWRISFARLEHYNSAALLACLAWKRLANSQGQEIIFQDIPENLRALMALTQIDRVLSIARTPACNV